MDLATTKEKAKIIIFFFIIIKIKNFIIKK